MIVRYSHIINLPSGNTARGFNVRDLGNGRVSINYCYTDRRRNNKVSRHFTAEFLNGRLDSIIARSARGGRVEFFKTSTILAELLEMIAEFNEVVQDRYAYEPAKVEETGTDLMSTVRLVGMGVAINLMVTLATLGIVWYNL